MTINASLDQEGRTLLSSNPPVNTLSISSGVINELEASDKSKGLRHVLLGKIEVNKIPNISATTKLQQFERIGVVGAGTMGLGIALVMLNSKLNTTLVDPDPESRKRALTYIESHLERSYSKNRISKEQKDYQLSILSIEDSLEKLAECDLVIEAVFEDIDVKRDVITHLDDIVSHTTVLASNTSSLDINKISSFSKFPERVIGMHFFSPAHLMSLLEIVRAESTSDDVLLSVMKFSTKINKVGIVSGVCDGFIGNRMFEEYLRQAYFLLEEGALPEQIDSALERWGMAMGPLKTMDLAGQDIGWSIRKRRAIEQPERPYSGIPNIICEMGRFGQKTGKGFYQYLEKRVATPDPEITDIIVKYSSEKGIIRRTISDQEIVDRCIYALINEGFKILDEKIAYRKVDVDMVYVNGYGFPAERGGPLFYAQTIGLDKVVSRIRSFQSASHAWCWELSDSLKTLVNFDATGEIKND